MNATVEAYNALCVITKDTEIRSFLFRNDPQALKQCDDAVAALERANPGLAR